MGLLTTLAGGATGGLVQGVAAAVDRFVDTPSEQAERDLKDRLAQLAVNEEEAKHASVFVAGWRPFIGWACGICLSIIMLVTVACWAFGYRTADDVQDLVLALAPLFMPVLMGILGLRTFEKHKGLTKGGK